mgnify:CR=1 FL=1
MMNRKLNEQGLEEFRQFIDNLRNGGKQNTPSYLLTDPTTSEPLGFELQLPDVTFSTRYELGSYLCEQFSELNMQSMIGDIGFWSSLALHWFDQLCPEADDGSRKPPSQAYNYILSNNYNHRPRHAIFTTWQLVDRYGEDARFLLCRELPIRGEITEQLMARQYFLSCRGLMQAASRLYYDEESGSFKKGAAARSSAGCIHRFVAWLHQIELTYDLYSLNCEDVLDLMPKEFDRFKAS